MRIVNIERLRIAAQQRVGASVAQSMRVEQIEDVITRDLVVQLEAYVLAEKLPPSEVDVEIKYEHPEAGGTDGWTDDPRWATWRDHFWASHRRLARLFRRTPRTIMTPVRYRVAVPVMCAHRATVDIRDHWTYPMSNTVMPPDSGFGYPVLKSQTFSAAEAVNPYDDWR